MTYNDFTFESLGEGIEICISDEHRFGTDAFLLADFSSGRHKDICADLCTGSGIVALLLHKFYKPQKIYAVEIQKKAHEQLKVSLEYYEANKPKGEFVLVIEGAKEDELCPAENIEEALEQVKALVEKGMRGADACREIAKATGFSKGELYGLLFK